MNKDVQKLTLRILLAIGLLFLVWLHFALKDPLDYADNDAADFIWCRRFAEASHSPAYDVLFAGDSLANCMYLPNYLPGRCANISTVGATPIHQYYVLRHYLENNAPPKTCYISFADHNLQLSDVMLTAASRGLFSFAESLEIEAEGKKYGPKFKTIPAGSPVWEFYIMSPRIYQLSLMRGIFENRRETNRAKFRHADIHAGAYSQPLTASFGTGQSTHDSFYTKPVNEAYYRRMLELCASYGVQVKLVKLPSHPAVSHTDGYRAQFAEYYGKLKADYPGIEVDWFEYGIPEDCFVDNMGHVDLRGGYLFCRMLAKRYPEDFDSSVPLSEDMLAGLEEYRQSGFDPDQAGPEGTLVDSFDD
jgi:hypothetical protein